MLVRFWCSSSSCSNSSSAASAAPSKGEITWVCSPASRKRNGWFGDIFLKKGGKNYHRCGPRAASGGSAFVATCTPTYTGTRRTFLACSPARSHLPFGPHSRYCRCPHRLRASLSGLPDAVRHLKSKCITNKNGKTAFGSLQYQAERGIELADRPQIFRTEVLPHFVGSLFSHLLFIWSFIHPPICSFIHLSVLPSPFSPLAGNGKFPWEHGSKNDFCCKPRSQGGDGGAP